MLKIVDIRILYVFSAIFIVPVCLAVRPSRGIIYRYFRQRHGYGRLRSAWKTYTNHCLFAQVVLDKFAMYAGRRFRTKLVGYENFLRLAAQPEGFIQLSAHVGNYEIAGYTLVYNSHGLKIKAHRPFEGIAKAIDENADIESEAEQVESFPRRRYIADCDDGVRLRKRIEALEALLAAFRSGEI